MKSLFQKLSLAFTMSSAAAALSATAQTPGASRAKLNSVFFDWDALVMTPTKGGSCCDVLDSPTLTFNRLVIQITTLSLGAAMSPPMRHPQEELILVKEGSLELWLDGKICRAATGSLIFLAANVTHNLTNAGDKPATYYVLDVYTDATGSSSDQTADESALMGKLNSTIFDPDHLPAKTTENGSSCWFVDSPTRTFRQLICHTTTLDPGKATPVGRDEADELIVVKSGLVQSTINGVSCRLAPGSFFLQASNDLHTMKNVGSTPATYEVIKIVTEKTPKPGALPGVGG